MKICKQCGLEKELNEFHSDKKSKDKHVSKCKQCISKYYKINSENIKMCANKYYVDNKEIILVKSKEYREDNKIKTKERNQKYYEDNKSKISENNKEYRKINKDKISKSNKEYREKNKEKGKEYNKKYRIENKDTLEEKRKIYLYENKDIIKIKSKNYSVKNKEYRNKREKNKRMDNPLYKLSIYVRSSILKSFKRNGYSKNSKSEEILGCSFEEFKLYLESKFEYWMTWENRGLYNGEFNYGWDIDHIIPLSSGKTEESLYILNHYTNLQPLCSKTNRDIKKDNLVYEK